MSTELKISSNKKPYLNSLSTLTKIFETLGQPHILSLVKLRKMWFTEMDSFLARNAYPRNISVKRKFTANSDFFNELNLANTCPDFLKVLKKLNGKSFISPEQLNKFLKNNLKRILTKEENDWLKNKDIFKPPHSTLHLTVYDGSISHAIRIEKKAYIHKFNNLLSGIIFDDIHCHVGDLEKAQFDRSYLESLKRDWELILPKHISQKCFPAFLHRVSNKYFILVLYVTTKENLKILEINPGVDLLLKHLQKKQIELNDGLKRITFVISPDKNFKKIKFRSLHQDYISKHEKNFKNLSSSDSQSNFSKKCLLARDHFQKIHKKLKR